MQFTFIIKEGRYNSYKKIAASLLLLNALLFFFAGIHRGYLSQQVILISTAILLTGYSIYFWKYKKKKEKSFIIASLLAALVWMSSTPSWYFALFYVLLLIIQLRIETDPFISVTKENIEIKGLFFSSYQWKDLNNAILNGGLLTLDFKNNKILQVEPDWPLSVMNKEYADWKKNLTTFAGNS